MLIHRPLHEVVAPEVGREGSVITLAPELKRLHHFPFSEVEVDEIRFPHAPPDAMTMNGITKAAMNPMMTSASSIFERVSKLSMMISSLKWWTGWGTIPRRAD